MVRMRVLLFGKTGMLQLELKIMLGQVGPLIIMSKYFAGIEPLKKGYDVISIKPQFGNLTNIETTVTTIKGDVKLEAGKTENSVTMKIDVPTKARVAIPKVAENFKVWVNNQTIYENGSGLENEKVKYGSEDAEYIYFYMDSGEYTFIVKV